ncbi:m4 family protein [Megaselia abdita]
MCVEIMNNAANLEIELKKSKTAYSLRKIIKSFFKKQQKSAMCKADSVESVENDQNMEIAENAANTKIFEIEDENEVLVPVHYVRTEHGTFFWTTNNPVEVDADLIQPMNCSTNNQLPTFQFQDRWAQA